MKDESYNETVNESLKEVWENKEDDVYNDLQKDDSESIELWTAVLNKLSKSISKPSLGVFPYPSEKVE